MRKNSGGMIQVQVPRQMIHGWMWALFPGLMMVFNIIDDPRIHGVRGTIVIRLVAIGWGAGMFFCGLLLFIMSKRANRTPAAPDLDQTKRQS